MTPTQKVWPTNSNSRAGLSVFAPQRARAPRRTRACALIRGTHVKAIIIAGRRYKRCSEPSGVPQIAECGPHTVA